MKTRILLVEDDREASRSTGKILELADYCVVSAYDGEEALEVLKTTAVDIVLSDIRMPKMNGIEFFRQAKMLPGTTPFILMTAFGEVEMAVEAMKRGAVDFLLKPFRRQQLLSAIENALTQIKKVSLPVSTSFALEGESPAVLNMKRLISKIAQTRASVLICGASGVGKERVARLIHNEGERRDKPFLAINCAALPESLIEAELFGYEKGAFTGATSAKAGLFEQADGGTLLLDEIGDLPYGLQPKLLRVLQDQEVRRLGATHSQKLDVRILAATHKNLEVMAKEGSFREDLRFRLEVLKLEVPSLSERKEDILLLTEKFLNEFTLKNSKEGFTFLDEAKASLLAHNWPGNIRELQNRIERAVVLSETSFLSVADLFPEKNQTEETFVEPALNEKIIFELGTPLKEIEDTMIQKLLVLTGGDKRLAAKLLGVNERTIYRKLEKRQT